MEVRAGRSGKGGGLSDRTRWYANLLESVPQTKSRPCKSVPADPNAGFEYQMIGAFSQGISGRFCYSASLGEGRVACRITNSIWKAFAGRRRKPS